MTIEKTMSKEIEQAGKEELSKMLIVFSSDYEKELLLTDLNQLLLKLDSFEEYDREIIKMLLHKVEDAPVDRFKCILPAG
jgi:hypothetical protein